MLRLGRRVFDTNEPVIMAIVHPTSHRDGAGGVPHSDESVYTRLEEAVSEGATIVDVSAVGPGRHLPVEEETRYAVGLVTEVRRRFPDLVIGVRTRRSEVGAAACASGADLLNDAGGGADPRLVEVAARFGVGLVGGHAGSRAGVGHGTDTVWTDLHRTTVDWAERAVALGVRRDAIVIDPGHDFGAATPWSLAATRRLGELTRTGWPVLVSLCPEEVETTSHDRLGWERHAETLATTAISAWLGARVYRVDEVAQTRQVLDMVASIAGHRPPTLARRGRAS